MKRLRPLLDGLMKRAGLYHMERQQRAIMLWPEVVGPVLAANAMARRVEDSTMVIITSGPAWSQEISFMKTHIIQRINRRVGGMPVITDLRFQVGRVAFQAKSAPARDSQPARKALTDAERQAVLSLWERLWEMETPLRRQLVAMKTQRIREDAILKARGWIICQRCGVTMRPPDRNNSLLLCSSCIVEREPVLARIRFLLKEAPWLLHDEILRLIPQCLREDYEEVRRERIGDLRAKARAGGGDEEVWVASVRDLVMMLTGRTVDILTPEDFLNVLPRPQALRALREMDLQSGPMSKEVEG